MELTDIINVLNDLRNGKVGHFILSKQCVPHRNFSAYKDFICSVYYHRDDHNEPIITVKETFKTNGEGSQYYWKIVELETLREILKYIESHGFE
ncbi:MAG: hypothetical protein U0K68_01760 [Agathobacter sp.]|nr:hypothetical protein [Agathobacter sp.]